jgi:hypothetical protein
MAKCAVTLNVARVGVAYVGRAITVADVIARDDGTYWTTTEEQRVPLSNGPLAKILLDRLAAYRFVLPDGSSDIRFVPDAPTADFSDLKVLARASGSPSFLVLEPDLYVEPAAVEPAGMAVGDYLLVNNPYSPTHGDFYQKTI